MRANCMTIDPDELYIDEMNERTHEGKSTSDLEESIRQNGIVQNPVVRYDEDNDRYTVVIGQRRVLAARAVGLSEIDVDIKDWDDYDAIKNSITENYELFRSGVADKERATALVKMATLADTDEAWQDESRTIPSATWLADELGDAKRSTINQWIERTRPEYEGTPYHVKTVDSETGTEHQSEAIQKENVKSPGDKTLRAIRTATTAAADANGEGGETVSIGEAGMELAEKTVTGDKDERFSQRDVEEVKRQAQRGQSVEEATKNVEASKFGQSQRKTIRLSGTVLDAVHRYARDTNTSDEQAIRDVLEAYLSAEGYL